MKGLFAWIGYSQVAVQYDRCARYAGHSKWNYWHLWNFALEGITSFTVMPLKLATYIGLFVATFAGLYGLTIIFITLILGRSVPGYPSLIVAILLMGGTQLMTLGILGEYIGRIFNEVKGRPLYLVERFVPARTLRPANQESTLGS
jgi:glycosyltransferase involved in cell wall biosynthesis